MAALYRLVAALLVLAVCVSANATNCTQYRWKQSGSGAGVYPGCVGSACSTWVSSHTAACSEAKAWYEATFAISNPSNPSLNVMTITSCTVSSVNMTRANGSVYNNNPIDTRTGDYCVCNPPNVERVVNGATVCEAACAPSANLSAGSIDVFVGGSEAAYPSFSAPGSICDSSAAMAYDGAVSNAYGCAVTGSKFAIGWYSKGPPGGWFFRYDGGKYSGADCSPPAVSTPTGTTTQTTEPNTCPAGYFKGSVNGVDSCIPPAPGTPTVTPTGSGTSTSTTSTPEGTAVTATTTSSTTICQAGACTTTTNTSVSTSVNGSTPTTTTGTTSTTQGQGEFCAKNPNDPACADSGFSGSCTEAFKCTGDAVQCAAALAVNKMYCALTATSDESALYESSKVAGTPTGPVTGSLPGSSTVTLSGSSFDTTDLIGGAAGMTDLTIDILGTPFVVKFSLVNPWLEWLGVALLAVTTILCIRIVFRG